MAALGNDPAHSAVSITVRAAHDDGVKVRARGGALIVDTGIGGPDRCRGPQCRPLSRSHPIRPAHVRACIEQALARGWDPDGTAELRASLANDVLLGEDRAELLPNP